MNLEKPERIIPWESRPGDAHTATYEEHTIDVYKLIHLAETLEEETISLSDLEHEIEESRNCWKDSDGNWLGPHMILRELDTSSGSPDWDKLIKERPEWAKEVRKIMHARYDKYPLLLIKDKLVDGMHRLTKAFIDGATEIKVKRFGELPEGSLFSEPGESRTK